MKLCHECSADVRYCGHTDSEVVLRPLTYRIIFFPKVKRYTGLAWNYEYGHMFATAPYDSYTAARERLGFIVAKARCRLRWFDGEYELASDGESLVPRVITVEQAVTRLDDLKDCK